MQRGSLGTTGRRCGKMIARMLERRHLGLAIGVALAAGHPLWACGGSAYSCLSNDQCSRDGEAGVCQPDGYCSFPDEACPSGQRYGEHAGKGLAGMCVSPADDDGTDTNDDVADTGSTSGSPTSGPDTSGSETGSSATESTSSPTTNATDDATETTTTGPTTSEDSTDVTTEDETTGPGIPCSIDEDFEDGILSNLWSTGGPLGVEVKDGMLGMELVSSAMAQYGWAYTAQMDITGRAVTVEIGAPPPVSSNAQLMLELTTTTTGYFMLIEGGTLVARTSLEGGGYTTHASTSFHPTNTRFVRMEEIGGMVRFSYGDGMDWTEWFDLPTPNDVDLTKVNVAIVGGTWQLETQVGFIGVDSVTVCP
jgi:hypothetical protein